MVMGRRVILGPRRVIKLSTIYAAAAAAAVVVSGGILRLLLKTTAPYQQKYCPGQVYKNGIFYIFVFSFHRNRSAFLVFFFFSIVFVS